MIRQATCILAVALLAACSQSRGAGEASGTTVPSAATPPAIAATQMPTTSDGVMLYYPATGRMVMGRVDAQSMEMAMKHAAPLNGPIMLMQMGGKSYVVMDMDEKMSNGQRMIDYFDRRTYGPGG
jgi:hypothetical protein